MQWGGWELHQPPQEQSRSSEGESAESFLRCSLLGTLWAGFAIQDEHLRVAGVLDSPGGTACPSNVHCQSTSGEMVKIHLNTKYLSWVISNQLITKKNSIFCRTQRKCGQFPSAQIYWKGFHKHRCWERMATV